MEEIIIRIKFMTLSCILILCVVGTLVFQGNGEDRQVAKGKEQLVNNNSSEAIRILEEVIEKSPENEEAIHLLNEAKKLELIQEIRKIDQAYKKGEFDVVEKSSKAVLMKYSTDPAIGFLTEKVVYMQQKVSQNDRVEKIANTP